MVQVGTSFPSQRGTRFMTSHQLHQHGSDEDWRVGFGPKASCKCPTAFAWLVLGNIYLTISKHIKQQVPRAATLCDAERRASYQTQAPSEHQHEHLYFNISWGFGASSGSKLISLPWIQKLRPPLLYLLPGGHHMETCQLSEAPRMSTARSWLSWKVILR